MHKMNKNVIHNGKSYPKGSKIEKGDDGFEALKKDGHVDSPEAEGEEEVPPVEGEGQDESGKQNGRRRR